MSQLKQLNFDTSKTPPKISQWFVSLEGEGNSIGEPSIYIRLAGCYSAACEFCDTKFSWGNAPGYKDIGDRDLSISLGRELEKTTPRRLTITGGEPMHFIEWFPDIYKWVNSMNYQDIDFLGIESNGNLLANKDNCLELIKSFNEIIHEHNVTPTLTISPKLDAKTCYDNQMTQEQVDTMYFNAFKNVIDYLKQYPVYFKFIFDYTDNHMDFNHNLIFIRYLIDELGIQKNHIMLMPFTPDDPLGKDSVIWKESMDATARKALELGVTYSPRIHIDRQLD